MTSGGLAAALAALPYLVVEEEDGQPVIVQPDGARLALDPGKVAFAPTGLGPGHAGGRFSPGGLEILDGWVLFPPGMAMVAGRETVVEGLPPLVSTRDLAWLARQAEEAALTSPPDPDRQRGLALAAQAVVDGARRAGLTRLEEPERDAARLAAAAPPSLGLGGPAAI